MAHMTGKYLAVLLILLTAVSASAAVSDKSGVQKLTPVSGESTPQKKPPAPGLAPDVAPMRGQLLHENHCTTCHESVVHIRSDRRAKSLKALEGWVVHWASEQKLGWGPEEVGVVVDYLNRRYYKFPPPSGGK
jgi:hypothetical protein